MPWSRRATRFSLEPGVLSLLILSIFTVNLSWQQSSAQKYTASRRLPIPADSIRFIAFADADPVIKAFSADLPEELVHAVAAHDESEWDKYVRGKDREIRERLRRGDLDTLANLLLFGTSYTVATPLTAELLKNIHAQTARTASSDL